MKQVAIGAWRSVLLGVALVIAGCGYSFQGGGSILPADITKIYIPPVINNSTEVTLSTALTEALKDRFERFGVVAVSDTVRDADAILEVKVLRVKRTNRSSTASTDQALQFDTTLYVGGELRRISGEVLWRDPEIMVSRAVSNTNTVVVTSSSDFASSIRGFGANDVAALSPRELVRQQEEEALFALAENAAQSIYNDAVAPDF